jgi:glycosyltransferase involved in cell wall biosynthesis
MRVHVLADRIPWFGQHTGYGLLPRYLGADTRTVQSRTTLNQIRLGRLYRTLRRRPWRDDFVYAAAELRFALSSLAHPADVHHVLYGEGHHYYFERWRKAPANVVATLHHPPQQWAQQHPSFLDNMRRIGSAIVLYRCDLDAFEAHVGRGRVRFVRHGVDTEFFRPPVDPPADDSPSLLFAGQNGRDTAMLYRVVTALADRYPEIRFDFLVRDTIRQRFDGLRRLSDHPAVRWHERIADEELRSLYQRSYLLLLPLEVCGATNSMVEALACGLPVIAPPVSVLPQLLKSGCGILIDEANPQQLARAVRECLSDPAGSNRYREMSLRAIATAQQYSLERWRETIGEMLRQAGITLRK